MNEVDTYLNNVPTDKRQVLSHIRKTVKELVPDAVESISYMMPAFKYKNKPLVYYAAFKNHMSIFPTPWPAEQFKEELKAFAVSKGTVQFTLERPLPDELLHKIILARKTQIDALNS